MTQQLDRWTWAVLVLGLAVVTATATGCDDEAAATTDGGDPLDADMDGSADAAANDDGGDQLECWEGPTDPSDDLGEWTLTGEITATLNAGTDSQDPVSATAFIADGRLEVRVDNDANGCGADDAISGCADFDCWFHYDGLRLRFGDDAPGVYTFVSGLSPGATEVSAVVTAFDEECDPLPDGEYGGDAGGDGTVTVDSVDGDVELTVALTFGDAELAGTIRAPICQSYCPWPSDVCEAL